MLRVDKWQTKIFPCHQLVEDLLTDEDMLESLCLRFSNGPANDAKQRDPPRDAVRREGERMSSPRPQIAKQNRTRRRART